MKELTSFGEFWLPDKYEERLPGCLEFSPIDGINLILVGRFAGVSESSDTSMRMLGQIDRHLVTMNRGYSKGTGFSSPGVQQQKFYFNEMFLGHVFDGDPLAFQSVTLQLTQLEDWVGRSGIAADYIERNSEDSPIYQVTYTPPVRLHSDFSRGRVILEHGWSYEGDKVRGVTVAQKANLRIDYPGIREFSEIQTDIARLADLAMLCMDTHVATETVLLRSPDIPARSISGTSMGFDQEIEYRAPRLKPITPAHHKRRHNFDMLLTLAELGGIDGIARWLDTAPKFQRALSSLMSTRNTDRIYVENRFLNITYAAEAFHRLTEGGGYMAEDDYDRLISAYVAITPEEHRDWLSDKLGYGNEPSLARRMRRLASRSRSATRDLVGSPGRWAQTISLVRNELTHLGSNSRSFDGGDLYYLSESVYSVLRVCMLLECGVPDSVLAAKSQSNAMTWHKGRIHRAIEKIRAQF